jgi:hypothetical protein
MLTFETVLSAFKDYLAEDTRYEVIMASRGYVILEWNSNDRELESAVACPTPEVMKEELLSDLRGYLQYKATLCNRNLTDDEWEQIEAQVDEMSASIQ